jgi:predicted Zn-dependent protease
MRRKLTAAVLVICLTAGCNAFLPAQIPLPRPMTEDDEARIARDFRKQARAQFKFIAHPEIERYVDRIGRRILAVMGPQPFEYRFFIVENRQPNAFAVPGGSIFFHTGLIERARTTDEVAGVMGHEVVHIKARHMARISGPDPTSLLAILGAVLSGGVAGQAAGVIGQSLLISRQFSYSRQLEMEADTLAARYMAEAGYDPRGAPGFLQLLDQERQLNPVDVPHYLMTHPLTQERVANMELVIRSLSPARIHGGDPDPLRKVQLLLRLERSDPRVVGEQEKLAAANPENAEALHLLAVAYHYTGRWPEARERYERAKEIDATNPAIDRDLGRLYAQRGEYRLARAALDRALAVEPQEPLIYFYLGELFDQEGRLADAVGAYLRAHNLAPTWPEPARRLGIVNGKLDRIADAHYYLARFHYLMDEDERAVANLERSAQILGPSSPRGQVVRDELETIRRRMR